MNMQLSALTCDRYATIQLMETFADQIPRHGVLQFLLFWCLVGWNFWTVDRMMLEVNVLYMCGFKVLCLAHVEVLQLIILNVFVLGEFLRTAGISRILPLEFWDSGKASHKRVFALLGQKNSC